MVCRHVLPFLRFSFHFVNRLWAKNCHKRQLKSLPINKRFNLAGRYKNYKYINTHIRAPNIYRHERHEGRNRQQYNKSRRLRYPTLNNRSSREKIIKERTDLIYLLYRLNRSGILYAAEISNIVRIEKWSLIFYSMEVIVVLIGG